MLDHNACLSPTTVDATLHLYLTKIELSNSFASNLLCEQTLSFRYTPLLNYQTMQKESQAVLDNMKKISE